MTKNLTKQVDPPEPPTLCYYYYYADKLRLLLVRPSRVRRPEEEEVCLDLTPGFVVGGVGGCVETRSGCRPPLLFHEDAHQAPRAVTSAAEL